MLHKKSAQNRFLCKAAETERRLAESAIGRVGKLLREEATKLGISTVSVPAPGTSQTCPRYGDRHPDNRESQAVFQCRKCGLYAHADWTASVIIRNRAYVRHSEWQSGKTPSIETAPTGWREQPSHSSWQPRLLMELSVFKPEGTATSSRGNRVRGPRPDRRIERRPQTPKLRQIQHETPISGYVLNLSTHPSPPVQGIRPHWLTTQGSTRYGISLPAINLLHRSAFHHDD